MKEILTLVLIVLFFGCSPKKNTFYIKTDNARGLKKSSKVYCRGIEIGDITDISLVSDSVLIEFAIDKGFNIPKNASIFLYNPDFINRALEIKTLKDRKNMYYPGDTIRVILNYESIEIDSLGVIKR